MNVLQAGGLANYVRIFLEQVFWLVGVEVLYIYIWFSVMVCDRTINKSNPLTM